MSPVNVKGRIDMAQWINRSTLARYNPTTSWWADCPREQFTQTCAREERDRMRFSEFGIRVSAKRDRIGAGQEAPYARVYRSGVNNSHTAERGETTMSFLEWLDNIIWGQ